MRKPAILILSLVFTACGLLGSQNDAPPEIAGKIVFAADDDKTSQIYTMNADGSDVKKLTDFGTDDGAVQPSWSHDGKQIMFSTTLRSSSNGLSLYIMDADGGNMRSMNEREGSDIPTPGNHARWSPDGSKIAFDRCVNCQVSTNHVIFSYEFEIDSVTQLTDFKHGVSNTNPTWNPDGDRIAFTSDRDYVDADSMRWRKDLYVMDADGSNPKRITESGFPGGYIWMTTNELIQTLTDRDTNLKDIIKLNVETGNKTPLKKDLEVKSQLWVFFDPIDQLLFTVNKNHKELPVIISSYTLDGQLQKQFELNTRELKSAIGFDWYIEKK